MTAEAWWLTTNPPHIGATDQLEAAAEEAARWAATVAASTPDLDVIVISSLDVDGPADDAACEWIVADRHPGCRHLAEPQPGAGLLDQPGRVYCLSCSSQAFADHGRTLRGCMACHQLPDQVAGLLITHGPVVIMALLCGDCVNGLASDDETDRQM